MLGVVCKIKGVLGARIHCILKFFEKIRGIGRWGAPLSPPPLASVVRAVVGNQINGNKIRFSDIISSIPNIMSSYKMGDNPWKSWI